MTDSTDIALMKRDIADIRKEIEAERIEIEKLKDQDTKRMRAAIVVLGGLVLSMGTYIWTQFAGSR